MTGARMRCTSERAAFSAAASAVLTEFEHPRACSTACTLACTTELLAMPTSVVDMLGFLQQQDSSRADERRSTEDSDVQDTPAANKCRTPVAAQGRGPGSWPTAYSATDKGGWSSRCKSGRAATPEELAVFTVWIAACLLPAGVRASALHGAWHCPGRVISRT